MSRIGLRSMMTNRIYTTAEIEEFVRQLEERGAYDRLPPTPGDPLGQRGEIDPNPFWKQCPWEDHTFRRMVADRLYNLKWQGTRATDKATELERDIRGVQRVFNIR